MKYREMPEAAIYPDPPPVPCLLLFLVVGVLVGLVNMFVPRPYRLLLSSVILDAWPFYFAHWLHELNPDSMTLFWCYTYVIVELTEAGLSIGPHFSLLHEALDGTLGFASVVLGIAMVYMARADLLQHYNEREPIGLHLGPIATLFFSYLYFQAKLYEVSEIKKRLILEESAGLR